MLMSRAWAFALGGQSMRPRARTMMTAPDVEGFMKAMPPDTAPFMAVIAAGIFGKLAIPFIVGDGDAMLEAKFLAAAKHDQIVEQKEKLKELEFEGSRYGGAFTVGK
jgi:hypothetical protein|uniref:Uncharacterized protein n=1 Tax=Prymnesium polylepis TaxID=72548 RepID=A0A7S4JCT1_9EUKA|mmetsp:Transcript_42128/g.104765  ORF Transcript_42128/g.104765 Transcript_42128/m.104765 type:complete len:107 (+) Transcript_42128:63-383(+)